MLKFLLSVIGLFFIQFGLIKTTIAQEYTISGYIEDAESGENLINANILDLRSQRGTTSNTYGFFSLTLPADSVEIRFSYVGYGTEYHSFYLDQDTTLSISMDPHIEGEEIEIRAERRSIQESPLMSTTNISGEMISQTPGLLGESDLMQTIELLPGVQSGTEGSSGMYVRGGGPDQNLILLDGVPIYNTSHLFGFFSIFNSHAIHDVDMYKGGFPARYGGRASSVLDITMVEGNRNEFQGDVGIGLAAADLTLQGPVFDDRTSFMISGRRSYIDVLAQPIITREEDVDRGGYYFMDFNAKLNHRISERNRLYLSMYGGDDRFFTELSIDSEGEEISQRDFLDLELGWGNLAGSLRWNHLFSNRLFSNLRLTYSRYEFDTGGTEIHETYQNDELQTREEFGIQYSSGIEDLALHYDFDYMPGSDHHIRFGGEIKANRFTPGAIQVRVEDGDDFFDNVDEVSDDAQTTFEYSLYAENEYSATDLWKIHYGLRHTGYFAGEQYYPTIQPRLSARRLLGEQWSVKASYAFMAQNVHLLSNNFVGLPTDLWVPVTEEAPPQTAHHVGAGVAGTIFNDNFEVSTEVFYKSMGGLIDYKEGAQFMGFSESWENNIETGGTGEAYGIEFFLQRTFGNTTGWIGYTLSKTTRRFDEINQGQPYPYKFDRRHDFSITLNHKLSDSWDISGTWVYGTGNAMTIPKSRYQRNMVGMPYDTGSNELIEYYGSRNSFREPAYHRLDLTFNHKRHLSRGERTLSLGAYNAYNRQNPFFIRLQDTPDGNRNAQQISLFPVIPAINYSFSF